MTDIIETVLESHGDEVLVHYGVPGMRWGHRKEYISSIRTSHRKRVAIRRKNRIKGHEEQARIAQKQIDLIKANPSKSVYTQAFRDHHIKELKEHRDTHLKAAKDIREGHLTDHQKKVLIGAGITAGVLAAYGGYRLWDTGAGHQLLNNPHSYKKNPLLRRNMSADEILKNVVKPINPDYGDLGTKMNCRRCTFAYEMRRRGLDVRATNTRTAFGQNIAGILNALNPNKTIPTSNRSASRMMLREAFGERTPISRSGFQSQLGHHAVKDLNNPKFFESGGSLLKSQHIFDAIAKEGGSGSRGELAVQWTNGAAHSMAWENIGGKIHIFDTQPGVHHDAKTFSELAGYIHSAGITRLDNQALNGDYLGRWIRNAK